MYQVFTENTSQKTIRRQNTNLVVFSSFEQCYLPVKPQCFSIKYVVEGRETYTINSNQYPLSDGQYLLANRFCEGYVEIESKRPAKGICIDILPEMISEVVAGYRQPGCPFPDFELDIFFNSDSFTENQYGVHGNHIGNFLLQLDKILLKNPFYQHAFTQEFFYTLSEKIVADHIPIYRQLQAIPALKPATRKDLFKRVARGKEWMDAHFNEKAEIETIAREACISPYHFFRLFKAVYQLSPLQYLIKKRLESAYQLLNQERVPVSVAAQESGFSDIYTFSKAFKKAYGKPPSCVSKL
jgi:AraC family transcriptional regulator